MTFSRLACRAMSMQSLREYFVSVGNVANDGVEAGQFR
jgi:hypothetical protein